MSRRRTRPPKSGYRSPLDLLVDELVPQLKARGHVIAPAAPWLSAGQHLQRTHAACGWGLGSETAQGLVMERIVARGWLCIWSENALVVAQPGWVPPAPVAVQQGLFQ